MTKIQGRLNQHQDLSRREMLGLTGAAAAAPLAFVTKGQSEPGAPTQQTRRPILNRFPRMLQESYVTRVRAIQREAIDRKASLATRADVERYIAEVRRKIALCFGPFPERTPLNPRISGEVRRDAYRIEKVIFDSRPGFPVTANLYLPTGRPFPLPAVVGSCGHADDGKAFVDYQSFAQGLARLGYVVLLIDPIGQGERIQYPAAGGGSKVGIGVREHIYAGNQQFLVGEFFGSWRAWDGIRALDYLLTRSEVDPKRIGITGNSGGGTMTTWLCGLDTRWAMAAPGCFVTSFLRNLENELPADMEQCPPRVLEYGLDHEDFIVAMAPKPVILLAKERDFFDVRGTEEAYLRLKRLYGLLGAPENIALEIGPGGHGYSKDLREAMYRWFNRVTGVSNQTAEPALSLETEQALRCTPNGRIAESGSRSVFSFTKAGAQDLAGKRQVLSEDRLSEALETVLKLPSPPSSVPAYRILRPLSGRGYPKPHAAVYAVEVDGAADPGIRALVYLLSDVEHHSRPSKSSAPAILYVAHQSADSDLREEPLVRELVETESGAVFFACDVRGIGESRPDTCGEDSFLTPYGSDYFYAIHSLMLGRPFLGQKTYDLLRVLEWIHGFGHAEIHLVGKGWGAFPAAFAALLSPHVTRVTLKNALTSFQEMAETEIYGWPLSCILPGVLARFDLPDCYRALQKKHLRQIDPWGANEQLQ